MSPTIINIISLVAAIACVFALGKVADKTSKKVLDAFDDTPPDGVDKDAWVNAVLIPSNTRNPIRWLGLLERYFFLYSFIAESPELVAGWLAFKVASKWETWNTVIKFPEKLDNIDPISYLAAKNRYGTNLLQRWLIGTLANILTGLIGAALYRYSTVLLS